MIKILSSYWKRPLSVLAAGVLLMIPGGAFAESYDHTGESDAALVQSAKQASATTVKQVLDYIEANSKYTFVYSADVQAMLSKQVNISTEGKDTQALLADLKSKGSLNARISGLQITLSVIAAPAAASKGVNGSKLKVSGNVTDEKGVPLIGVTVLMKGNQAVNAVTNTEGAYTIFVPDHTATLAFSYVGYIPKEETVGTRRILNVTMPEDVGQLEEVVVVAYGVQKKESVVGAITTVAPGKLQVGTTRSMSNNLAGVVSGVIGVQRSGEPGYDNSSFWIRGISTFQGASDPLVLVDGIERSLNNIDPEEIESFSVLKDAAASAVYGVRGANGVILINTKRGKEGKPRIVLKSEFAFTQPVQLPDYIGAADYMEILDEIRVDAGLMPNYTERIAKTRANYDPDLYPDVNWLETITKNHASNQRVTLDVSGGSDRIRYSFVAAFYNEQGILSRDKTQEWDSSIKLQRYNVRSNVDLKLTPTTNLRFNIGGYLQDKNAPPQDISYVFSKAFTWVPFAVPPRYSSGEIPMTEEENPWALATQTGYSRNSQSRIETLFSLDQDLKFVTPGLRVKLSFSFDRFSVSSVKRSRTPDYYNPATGRNDEGDLILTLKKNGSNTLGYEKGAEFGDKSVYMEANITYNRTFGKHGLEGLLLFSRRNYDDGSKVPFRNQGLAGRLSYTLNNRYVAEFNFGYNGSENFAKGKRYGFFPSCAIGWIVSEEKFMEPLQKVISKLKIRGSYGQVGNANLSGRRFAYISTINEGMGGYYYGDNKKYSVGGIGEGDFGVDDLTWELVNKANIGFELGLFRGMVDITADFFDERRNDIFMERQSIPSTAGFNKTPWSNYGKVTNRGVDLSVNINKQIRKDLFLSFYGTFTYARNKIVEKDEPIAVIGTTRAETGHPVGQWFGYIADGLYSEDDFLDVNTGQLKPGLAQNTLVAQVRPGDIKYRDIDGNNRIDPYDKTAIGGTYNPEIVYGLGLSLSWRGIDAGILCQGNGRTYNMIGRGAGDFIPGSSNGARGNVLSNVSDRWTVDHQRQDVFWPRLYNGTHSSNSQLSTWWLKDMSMLRVKNIELGYSFPQRWLNKIYLSGLRVYLRATNPFTISDFDLWDPEVSTATGAAYPIMKSYSAGLEIKF